jgi:hypothetical protein
MSAADCTGKQCCRCGVFKTSDQFKAVSGQSGKLRAWCKACCVAYQREQRAKIVTRRCVECGLSYQTRNGESRYCQPCGESRRLKNLEQGPQMRLVCQRCGTEYPSDHRRRQFCSRLCKTLASRGRKRKSVTVAKARVAQAAIATELRAGRLVRPTACEQCQRLGVRIEAAHYDYDCPLKVRWLCRSCHVKWDRAQPKGGAISVSIA